MTNCDVTCRLYAHILAFLETPAVGPYCLQNVPIRASPFTSIYYNHFSVFCRVMALLLDLAKAPVVPLTPVFVLLSLIRQILPVIKIFTQNPEINHVTAANRHSISLK